MNDVDLGPMIMGHLVVTEERTFEDGAKRWTILNGSFAATCKKGLLMVIELLERMANRTTLDSSSYSLTLPRILREGEKYVDDTYMVRRIDPAGYLTMNYDEMVMDGRLTDSYEHNGPVVRDHNIPITGVSDLV